MYIKQTTKIPELQFHIIEGVRFNIESLVLTKNKAYDFSMKGSCL